MAKQVSFSLEKMLAGLRTAARAVGGTIGPKGRNVYLQEVYGNKVTNDGVTVASKVILKDQEEDAGAFVIRNVTGEQNDKVGDGTTTVAILTEAIIDECLKRPENPMDIRTSLNKASEEVIAQLKELSVPVEKDDIGKVALISAEDPVLSSMITALVSKLGVNAVISVEDSKTLETHYDIVDGYEAQSGYLSPHFADPKTGKATLTDCPVLVTDRKISNVADIKPIFDQFAKNGVGSAVIVCDDIDDSMLGILVINRLQGKFQALVIKAHGDTLKDIAAVTGATVVSATTGLTFQNITIDKLGHAKKVVADAHKTLFVVEGDSGKIYADVLEKEQELEPNQFIKQRFEERIAQLRGGIAVLRVAAHTDFEREYLKLKAEDAIKAVQAALAEGVVEGGGLALWGIAQGLKGETVGEAILKKALTAPFRKIVENAGRDYAEVVSNMNGKGYNARTDTYEDLMETGVVDPTKVERLALSNAVSAAGTFITTFAVITDIPDEKQ